MNQLFQSIQALDSISLTEMDHAKLMDRIDTKYVLYINQLPSLFESIKEEYRILEIQGQRMMQYESVYYDTNEFDLFRQHHCGKLNRYKIRFRKYVESNTVYFEIKLKNNKFRTLKERILLEHFPPSIQGTAQNFLESKTPLCAQDLHPVLQVNYTRMTLVHPHSAERVTLDLNMHISNFESELKIDQLMIIEVKQEKSKTSPITQWMKNHQAHQGFMSKYCFGISSLVKEIRKNNFKQKLIQFNKMNDYVTSA